MACTWQRRLLKMVGLPKEACINCEISGFWILEMKGWGSRHKSLEEGENFVLTTIPELAYEVDSNTARRNQNKIKRANASIWYFLLKILNYAYHECYHNLHLLAMPFVIVFDICH